jgi:hypothetical protein
MLRTFEIRKYPLDSFLLAAYAITRSTYPKVLEESRAEVAIGVMESERNLEQECGCGCLSWSGSDWKWCENERNMNWTGCNWSSKPEWE